jgi:hypothetical protein
MKGSLALARRRPTLKVGVLLRGRAAQVARLIPLFLGGVAATDGRAILISKNLFMKKLLFCLALLMAGCAADHVNVTRVDEEQFDVAVASVEDLPFAVTLPDGWSVREEALLYTLSFDEGASGYIQVAKAGAASLSCEAEGPKKYCTVSVDYSVVLTDKSMSEARRAEAEEILWTVE